MAQSINTAKSERRTLHFQSLDEVLADVDRIVAAERAGKLRRTGNWTTGQVFGHLASWIEYGYVGYPFKAPPFFIRWFLRRKIYGVLRKGMPAGVNIPGVPGGTHGAEMVSTDEAAARLRQGLQRLKKGERCPHESPAIGPMSHDERIKLNLRHAELHLGFLHP